MEIWTFRVGGSDFDSYVPSWNSQPELKSCYFSERSLRRLFRELAAHNYVVQGFTVIHEMARDREKRYGIELHDGVYYISQASVTMVQKLVMRGLATAKVVGVDETIFDCLSDHYVIELENKFMQQPPYDGTRNSKDGHNFWVEVHGTLNEPRKELEEIVKKVVVQCKVKQIPISA